MDRLGRTRRWRSGASRRRIHVETAIGAPMEEVWRVTQAPELHERWDDRFTTIACETPAAEGRLPQRFTYTRRLVPGLTIRGWGETVGERHRSDGTATSALRFGSDDRRSIIREGAGFWQYVPIAAGVRFLTEYDYEVRWGVVGRWLDRAIVRPWIAWETSRSFERLRRWLEEGTEP